MKKKLSFIFSVVCSVFVFSQAGNLDTSFNPQALNVFNIFSVANQSNGKVLVGSHSPSNLARYNEDGSLDTTFKPDFTSNLVTVFSIVEQPDQKILYAGVGVVSGTQKYISRINQDGSKDEAFEAAIGTGANNNVNSIALQADGKILLAGDFTIFNGVNAGGIIRLNSDGTVDSTFNAGSVDTGIASCVLLKSGKIIISGSFKYFNGVAKNYIARLNEDGSLDTSFNANFTSDNYIYSNVVEDANANILVGIYYPINNIKSNRIIRLKTDGSLDSSFSANNATDSNINTIALQQDQKIIIAGNFTKCNGISNKAIARLNSDGSLDSTFSSGTGVNSNVSKSLISKTNNEVFIVGGFSSYNEISRPRIAKILLGSDLSTTDDSQDFEIEVYPNPTHSKLFISNNNFRNYEILNFAGQKLLSSSINTSYVDVSDLLKGTYIINFTTKTGKKLTKKFIKQ